MIFRIVLFINFSLISFSSIHSDRSISRRQKTAGIDLIISNIRNKDGLIRIGVFESENGYPDKPQFSFSLAKDTIFSGKLRLYFPLKQPGSFAISVLDDENENGKMDYFFGIKPKEGFGFSNNPGVTSRKAPPFSETRFNYTGGRIQIRIKMNYI